jgi:RNA polymerase sigma factor (TIGR02999 family)
MDTSSRNDSTKKEKTITDLLAAWAEGDLTALNELMTRVYAELQEIARRAMARERPSHTLDPTALVHEAYERLLPMKNMSWEGRGPFFALAARLMRNILVEHARAGGAKKRGGDLARVTLSHPDLRAEAQDIDLIDLHSALLELEARDPNMVKMIDMRFFTGATEEEIAAALGMSRSSVQREWAFAKRFLADRLRRSRSA